VRLAAVALDFVGCFIEGLIKLKHSREKRHSRM
jgi:hypothetical protein